MIHKKEITKEKALERLESLCSRSEQCEFDLERKMLNWHLNRADREEVLQSLRENRYVDNTRFANSFAMDKARFSSWGPGKIRMELILKKIPSAVIKSALERVEPQVWKDGLIKSARSKARSLDFTGEDSYKEAQKLYRYLISRGFSSSSVSKIVKAISKQDYDPMG